MRREWRYHKRTRLMVSNMGDAEFAHHTGLGKSKREPGDPVMWQTPRGYLRTVFKIKGKRTLVHLHHIVAELFIGPRRGRSIDHKNFNKHDNRATNLRYLPVLTNLACAFQGNRMRSKLTQADVGEIKRLQATGLWSVRRLAFKFGVWPSSIQHALRPGSERYHPKFIDHWAWKRPVDSGAFRLAGHHR